MKRPTKRPRVEISSSSEEDEFWILFGKSLITSTIDVLDDRAKFMIRTSASLLVVDFAVLLIALKATILTISPQFFFALSVLCFVVSLFPKRYQTNPWTPDETKSIYFRMLNYKRRGHLVGFLSFFLGLILVALTSLI